MSDSSDFEEIDLVGDKPEDIDEILENDADFDLQNINESSSGYPSEFNTTIPAPSSKVWTKIPQGLISDVTDHVEIEMDEQVYSIRMAQFGTLASAMISELLQWCLAFGAFKNWAWSGALVSACSGVFLRWVDPSYFAEFVTSNTNPYFVYLVLHPDFRPSDLLRLPRVAKTDVGWGIYMSIFTDKNGNVVAWYVGSASGFGSIGTSKPSGIIGRMISYWTKCDLSYEHSRWLHTREDLTVRFVKIADVSPTWSVLHRVYTFALETLCIVLFTFDTALKTATKFRPQGTADWVTSFRRSHNIPEFPGVDSLNHALPLKQGVPADKRFLPEVRTCANPVAVCKAGIDFKPSQWVSLHSGKIWSGKFLCGACAAYHRELGVHRPQAVVDKYVYRQKKFISAAETCYWCYRELPKRVDANGQDLGNRRHSLDVCGEKKVICERCGADWKNFNKRLPAIPGVHIPADHQFQCQSQHCSQADKTMAKKWFFTETGLLQCELCRFAIDASMTNNERKMARRRIKEIDMEGKVPHKLGIEDIKLSARRKGTTGKVAWYTHCQSQLGIDTGSGDDTDAVRERKVKDIRDQVELSQTVDEARRAEWYGDEQPASVESMRNDQEPLSRHDFDESTLVEPADDELTLIEQEEPPVDKKGKGKARTRTYGVANLDDDDELPFVADKRRKSIKDFFAPASAIESSRKAVLDDDEDDDIPLRSTARISLTLGSGKVESSRKDAMDDDDTPLVPRTRRHLTKGSSKVVVISDDDEDKEGPVAANPRRRLVRRSSTVEFSRKVVTDDDDDDTPLRSTKKGSPATPAAAVTLPTPARSRPKRAAAPAHGTLAFPYTKDDLENEDWAG